MAKFVLITGDGLRHRYAYKFLNSHLNIVGIISEKKPSIDTYTQTDKIPAIISNHFSDRARIESELLGDVENFTHRNLVHLERGQVNSAEVSMWINNIEPDMLILYGSGIIKNPLLESFNGRIVNLHLGLSPYYRGSGTNFWPLVDNLPECVGATIHLASREVDAGNILSRVRPEINVNDTVHHIGTKALVSGLEKMVESVSQFLENSQVVTNQNLKIGKVYYRKDFNEHSLIKLKKNFDNGMLASYLSEKSERDKKFPI